MPLPAPLPPESLYQRCDPATLGIVNSLELADLDTALIHGRAVEAIQLGLDIRHDGYNLYVLGEPGSGRHAIVGQLLEGERHRGRRHRTGAMSTTSPIRASPRCCACPAGAAQGCATTCSISSRN